MATRFDWAVTALSALFLGGLFLDGWAHTHGRVDESFFTPWHAALYAGYVATAALLVGRAAWGIRRGAAWRHAMPAGYGLSLAGVACWIVGGPFDAVWHTVFGFEADVEALMSPAHTLLALGVGLMASGPLRAALRRPRGGWLDELPMVLSLTFVISIVTFFTQIAHPVSNLFAARGWPPGYEWTALGVIGTVFTSLVLVVPALFLLKHGRLPAGAITIMVTLNAVAMGFLFDRRPFPGAVVVSFALAAVAADFVRGALHAGAVQRGAFRAFAIVFPILLSGSYFVGLGLRTGLTWTPHLWLGTVVFCGVACWLVSYLVLPPATLSAPASPDR